VFEANGFKMRMGRRGDQTTPFQGVEAEGLASSSSSVGRASWDEGASNVTQSECLESCMHRCGFPKRRRNS
jgi:hypothetical protein